MKKYIYSLLTIILLSLIQNNVLALEDYSKILKQVPNNFTNECYQNIYTIDKSKILNEEIENGLNNYKLIINNYDNLTITQSWFILPFKSIWEELSNIGYYNEYAIDVVESNDNNVNTYIELDTLETKELIFELEKSAKSWNFDFEIDYESKNYNLDIYISKDNDDFSKVSKNNIDDFDFKYIKLKAECKNLWCIREKIKIYELNIKENKKSILIKSFFNEDIKIYSNYKCSQKEFDDTPKPYDNFSIDNSINTINIDLTQNKNFNPQKEIDNDNDWILNEKDNCLNIYNPKQKDSNSDWKWDACSDNDWDWIIWNVDNCVNVYNPDQTDSDNDWVWDACEEDQDKDWIYDKIDNCPLIKNSEQIDSDNDWIWDICDNCPNQYNKEQKDIDQDWIWDKCDKEDNRAIESNRWIFITIMLLIIIIFWVSIFYTVKKFK